MSLIAGTSTPQHLFSQELDKVRKEARERAIAAVRREKTFIVRQKANILKEKATGENSKDNGVKIEQVNENCNLIKAEQTEDENNPLAIATSKDSISPTQIQNELQQALITSSSQPFTTKGPISPATVDDGQKYKGLKSAGKRKRGDDSVSQDKGLFLDSSQRPSVSEGRRIRALQNNQEKRNIGVGTNLETANLPALVTQPNVSSTSRMPRVINRGHLAALQYTTVLIKRAREAVTAKVNSNGAMLNLRKRLNDMEVWDFVDEQLVARSKVFDQSSLYGVTFDLEFPWDIRRDAERLLSKWDSKDFNTDLMRGVETRRGTNKNSLEFKIRSLEKAFPMVKANYHGQGNLYNGQWWPLQICTIRDGAHGSFEGGIYGKPGAGTFSIVLSSGGYKDIDNGNVIKYCGTAGKEGEVSAGTKRLMESRQLENEIRVLRNSAMSATHSAYRPEKGIRFDGMYKITSMELLHSETMMHRFTMERCPNQDPIRYQGLEKRPTEQQLAKLEELQIRFCG